MAKDAKETAGDSGQRPAEVAQAAGLASSKYVVYIGQFGVREIDTASWDHVNVKDQKKVVWSRENGWSVPVDQFTNDALRYVDELDSDFVIRDVEVPRAD